MQEKKKSKMKIVIVILSVLLAINLVTLAGTLLYNHFSGSQPASVTVPDNIITPEKDENVAPQANESQDDGIESTDERENTISNESSDNGTNKKSTVSQTVPASSNEKITATTLSLYKRHPDDNKPFKVENMFPGDRERKYYCVRVSHKGDVTLRFHADIRPGYEKLAEVLKCRIVLPDNGEVLYDGLMRDMPDSVNHKLRTGSATTSEVYYKITAYLDTSVGNEYMDKTLIADFRWWVEEPGEMIPAATGDPFHSGMWICLASGSLFLLILLWRKCKREEVSDER